MSSSDDEDDPVVKEIDIYLAKGLAEKLFLFQYPVRPSSATYDFTPHLSARIKPLQQKVELQLGIDTNSSTYCYSRGEQIAHAVDRDDLHHTKTQEHHFPSNVMDRQQLTSVKATEDITKYAAALYSNDSIHISPVEGVLQFHPSFTYFDKAEENQRTDAAQAKDDDAIFVMEDEAKPVQLRFGKVSQKKKDPGTKQAPADERWIETHFHQCHDRRAAMERNALRCSQVNFESPEFSITSQDYLQILSPFEKHGSEYPAELPDGVLSLQKLKHMSLSDQIKALLMAAKVLQFNQLCTLLGGGIDTSKVLSGLTQYAVLVQGCWVVKSEILYPEGSKSHISNIDAARLWPSRDYIMFCFNRQRVLSRREVASNTCLPTEELLDVLQQMGVRRPSQGWEFMLNTDDEFLDAYPEVCANQLTMWKQRYEDLAVSLRLSEKNLDFKRSEENFPGLNRGLRQKSGTSSHRSRSPAKTSIADLSPSRYGIDFKIEPEPNLMHVNQSLSKNPEVCHSKTVEEHNHKQIRGLTIDKNLINPRSGSNLNNDSLSVEIRDNRMRQCEERHNQDKGIIVGKARMEETADTKLVLNSVNSMENQGTTNGAVESDCSVQIVPTTTVGGVEEDELFVPRRKRMKSVAVITDDDG